MGGLRAEHATAVLQRLRARLITNDFVFLAGRAVVLCAGEDGHLFVAEQPFYREAYHDADELQAMVFRAAGRVAGGW